MTQLPLLLRSVVVGLLVFVSLQWPMAGAMLTIQWFAILHEWHLLNARRGR